MAQPVAQSHRSSWLPLLAPRQLGWVSAYALAMFACFLVQLSVLTVEAPTRLFFLVVAGLAVPVLLLVAGTGQIRFQETRLASMLNRMQLALDSGMVGAWDRNLITNESMLGDGWKLQLGFEPEELSDDSSQFFDRLHPEDLTRVLKYNEDYLQHGGKEPYELQFRLRHKNGNYRWFWSRARLLADEGKPEWLFGIHVDVTETGNVLERLKASENRYRGIVEDLTELIIRWKPDGACTFVNGAYCRYCERPPEALMGRNVFEHVHPDDAGIARGRFDRLKISRSAITTTHRAIRPDGSIAWQQWTDRAIYEGNTISEVQSVGRDVTDERRMEESLRDRLRFEQLLGRIGRNFLDTDANEYLAVINQSLSELTTAFQVDRVRLLQFDHHRQRWEILTAFESPELRPAGRADSPGGLEQSGGWNQFCWLTGQLQRDDVVVFESLAELPAAAAEDRLLLEQAGIVSLLQIPLRGKGSVAGAVVFESLKHPRRWTAQEIERGRLLGGLIADVLARVHHEREAAFRMRFEAIIADAGSRLMNCDPLRVAIEIARLLERICRFLDVDRARVLELLPDRNTVRTRAEWRGTDIPEFSASGREQSHELFRSLGRLATPPQVRCFVHLDDMPAQAEPLKLLLQSEGVKSTVLVPVTISGHVTGMVGLASIRSERYWSEDRLPLLIMVGDLIGHALQRERMAIDLEDQRRKLARSGQLSIMGEMAAGIAHDIKQPLHAIRGFSASIVRGTMPDAAVPADLGQINYWAERISGLVDRSDKIVKKYRDFCRPTGRERLPLDVSQLVETSLSLVQQELRDTGVNLLVQLPGALPMIQGDQVQLQQVLVNILRNACQELEHATPGSRVVEISAELLGEELPPRVVVCVRDHGRGLSDANLSQVFDLFFTTKPAGTGIGLAICRTIVEDHGGAIVARQADPGLVFELSFPAIEAHNP